MSDNKTPDIAAGAGRHAAFIFAREATAHLARASQEWMRPENLKEALRLATSHANNLGPHKAGHTFEFLETLKFNVNAAEAGETIRAITTASLGQGTATADILIKSGDEVVKEVQAKLYGDAQDALRALRDAKYNDMGRLVPVDQEPDVRRILAKALDRNPENINTSKHLDVEKNLSGQLAHGDVASGGTTSKDAYDIAADPAGWLRDETFKAMANETLKAAAIGAASGAVFCAAGHSLQLALKARHGEVSLSESVVSVARVAGSAAVRSGSTSGLAKVVEIGARNSEVFSTLAETTAPIAVASAVLEIGEAAYRYATGKIDAEELADRCAGAALRNTSAWAYGMVGQTLIPVPIVGALVGSTAGYATSALVIEGFKMARVAAAAADAAEERLVEIELQVYAAVMSLEEHRLGLEALIDAEAAAYREVLVPIMDDVERELTAGHDDEAMGCLVALNLELGAKLEWSALPDFDEFMADPQRPLQL